MAVRAFLRHSVRAALVLSALSVVGLLVAPAPGAERSTASTDLTITWADEYRRLDIVAVGFRGRSAAQVRVGSQPWLPATADQSGTIQLAVPLDGESTGQAGTTVLVNGRGSSGGSRPLVGAVPPRAVGRGVADLAPWAVAALLAMGIAGAALSRCVRRGRQPVG